MPIDPEIRKEYTALIEGHQKELFSLDREISIFKKRIQKDKKLEPLIRFGVIVTLIKQAELRLKINELSEQMMSLKNSSILDAAKKNLNVIFSNIEAIVTLKIDESLNFNRDMLDQIKPFNAKQRLNMLKHIKKIIKDLIRSYGENTKWKWSFPDLWTKFAISGKNLFDFREYQQTRDPRMEFYHDLQEYLQVVKDSLFFAARENSNKFRLSTKSPADILMGVKLLEDLRRIASLTNDNHLVKKSKSGIDSYKASLEAEEKIRSKK